ncbi:transferase family protein [Medicago truncatula]|uniref:Transferase family protein n=1 Tax=Medicago truncatula TaxID=3880 RepID=G7IZN4_MEDTR|nr:transferase family protein [Medicago truncatula]
MKNGPHLKLKSGQVINVQMDSVIIRSANPYLATPEATIHDLDLSARNPKVTYTHHGYEPEPDNKLGTIYLLDDMMHRTFFFGPTEVAPIRTLLPPHQLQPHSYFEIISAYFWRYPNLLLPDGYYGNAFVYSVTITTAGKLIENPLAYALDLVKKEKTNVTKEYMQSTTDLMVIKGRPYFNKSRLYLVSDVTRAGFRDVEFGWGKPVYGGPAKGGDGANPGLACFRIAFKNVKGEEGVLKRWMCLRICHPNDSDYRRCSGAGIVSTESSPTVSKVFLKISLENIVKDIPSLTEKSWIYGDIMANITHQS